MNFDFLRLFRYAPEGIAMMKMQMKGWFYKYSLPGAMVLFLYVAISATYRDTADSIVPQGIYELVYPSYFGNRITIPADNALTKEGVFLGRMLFYETRLSANNSISCASCHQQELAFTDGKAFSIGVSNVPTTRNSMSLSNLAWVRSYFWDGRAKSLEEQGGFPIIHPDEMGESLENIALKLQQTKQYPAVFKIVFGTDSITGDRIIKALAQFERTLISANSNYDKYLQGTYELSEQELRGLALYFTSPDPEKKIRGANCNHCHTGPKMFSDVFHNNGLDIVAKDSGRQNFTGLSNDNGRFRAVSLRNIALTAPYMHDGRFNSLEEVLDQYSEHIQQSATLSPFLQGSSNEKGGSSLKLSKQEQLDLIAFLQTLTDSSFITNPAFSNPNK